GCRQYLRAHGEHPGRRLLQRPYRHGRQESRSTIGQARRDFDSLGQSFRECRLTMAWFKKSEEGETPMMNANFSGRSGSEPSTARPEPREPRAEPRTPTQRAAETKATEPRPVEVRVPGVRTPEAAPRASVLGPTLRFRGELSAQEDLIVQGSVEGSITHTQSLTIGTDGTMKGDIRARVIVIDGSGRLGDERGPWEGTVCCCSHSLSCNESSRAASERSANGAEHVMPVQR